MKTDEEMGGLREGETLEQAENRVSIRKAWHIAATVLFTVVSITGVGSAVGGRYDDTDLNIGVPIRKVMNAMANKVVAEGAEVSPEGVQVMRRLGELGLFLGGAGAAFYYGFKIARDRRSLRGIHRGMEYRDREVSSPAAPQ